MYSKTACELYKWTTNFSFKLFVTPYFIVNGNKGITDVKVVYGNQTHIFVWQMLSWFHILRNLGMILAGIMVEIVHPYICILEMSESAQFYFLASFFYLFLAFRICNLFFAQTTVQLQNAFFAFNTKLTKLHKINPRQKDGTEIFTIMLLFIGFGGAFVTIPGTVVFIHLEIHFAEYFNFDSFIIHLLAGIFMGYCILVDFLVIFQYVDATLAYCNFTYRCLNLLRWKKGICTKKFQQFISIYSGHQAFHNAGMSDCAGLIAIICGLACIAMIAILYTIIGHYDKINILISLAEALVGLITMIFIRICLNVATNISDSSRAFLSSFLRNDFTLSKLRRKRLIASRVLYVKIGDFGVVTRKTFPILMSNFVLTRVVELLLMNNRAVKFNN